VIAGGLGADTLTGGEGADVFRFDAAAESSRADLTADVITDFEAGIDKIDVSELGFTGLGEGSEGDLVIGYDADTNRTFIRDDNGSDFELYLEGDYQDALNASDFIFAEDPTDTEDTGDNPGDGEILLPDYERSPVPDGNQDDKLDLSSFNEPVSQISSVLAPSLSGPASLTQSDATVMENEFLIQEDLILFTDEFLEV
jgi:hypothetical protein